MFTGIIEETGIIRSVRPGSVSSQITIGAGIVTGDLKLGDSVSTNGVCLTVVAFGSGEFTVDVMPETMRKTTLGLLKKGARVNLERAVRLSDRLGGHLVSGHIDGTGRIARRWTEDNAIWFQIGADPSLLHYMIDKGSVAIDGISLTVVTADSRSFRVSVIPHTSRVTTLTDKREGDQVNIECDLVAKYLEKLTVQQPRKGTIDKDFLLENGF